MGAEQCLQRTALTEPSPLNEVFTTEFQFIVEGENVHYVIVTDRMAYCGTTQQHRERMIVFRGVMPMERFVGAHAQNRDLIADYRRVLCHS